MKKKETRENPIVYLFILYIFTNKKIYLAIYFYFGSNILTNKNEIFVVLKKSELIKKKKTCEMSQITYFELI